MATRTDARLHSLTIWIVQQSKSHKHSFAIDAVLEQSAFTIAQTLACVFTALKRRLACEAAVKPCWILLCDPAQQFALDSESGFRFTQSLSLASAWLISLNNPFNSERRHPGR